jgi:phosphoribosyl 1,2-cyclic phosphodiesterase
MRIGAWLEGKVAMLFPRQDENAPMKLISLQSGSNGNCTYVEADGVRLLFDAGISGCQAERRLACHGRDIRAVDAVLISHDHRDHTRSMGIFQRKFGLPVYVTAKTLATAGLSCKLGKLTDVRDFRAGATVHFGHVRVETIPTPHDGVDGLGFIVDDGQQRLGILTDLGHVFRELEHVVRSLDAVLIESNYDPTMLATGPYPEFLKRRIRGPHGHLSNVESAELLAGAMGGRLQWACLAHLSEENNRPELALRTHREIHGDRLPLHVASRYEVGGILEVGTARL